MVFAHIVIALLQILYTYYEWNHTKHNPIVGININRYLATYHFLPSMRPSILVCEVKYENETYAFRYHVEHNHDISNRDSNKLCLIGHNKSFYRHEREECINTRNECRTYYEYWENNKKCRNIILLQLLFIQCHYVFWYKPRTSQEKSQKQIKPTISSTFRDNTTTCAICLEEFDISTNRKPEKILHKCGHKFHEECVNTWLRKNRSCPICKTNVL